jgi:hypothetical protein
MKTLVFLILFLCCTLTGVYSQQGLYVARKSKVEFVSDAPLELIKATSEKLQGIIDPDNRTFAFSVTSESFKGFNSPLQQEHFYENYLETKVYPISKFEGKIIEQADFSRDGNFSIRAKGKLNIHGVEEERIIKVQIRISKAVVYADAAFTVLLVDHDITIPKVVFQKIAEEIKVTVKAEFVKKE